MSHTSKNMTAAQKHFEKKRVKYDRTIRSLEEERNTLLEENRTLKEDLDFANKQISTFLEQMEQLRELVTMTPEEAKDYFDKTRENAENTKKVKEMFESLGVLGRLTSGGYC